jgi:hypothetical protein
MERQDDRVERVERQDERVEDLELSQGEARDVTGGKIANPLRHGKKKNIRGATSYGAKKEA